MHRYLGRGGGEMREGGGVAEYCEAAHFIIKTITKPLY